MTNAVERLLERLDLDPGETTETTSTWHGETGKSALNMSNRLFGGMVVAQTVVAAGRTHPEHKLHSVQQFFLRGGRADSPATYRVERLFQGRTYASVRVEVHQSNELISHAQIGLSMGIDGPNRQDAAPTIVPRDQTVNRDELRKRANWEDQPVAMHIDPATEGDALPVMETWIHPAGPMPQDPLLHKAVLAYVSDRALMSVAWRPHGEHASFKGSTLDHSLWFHRPVQFDDWHSYCMQSPTIADGRGLNIGQLHHHDGTHVATSVQQGTFREV